MLSPISAVGNAFKIREERMKRKLKRSRLVNSN